MCTPPPTRSDPADVTEHTVRFLEWLLPPPDVYPPPPPRSDPADVTEHTVRFLEWLLPMMAICVQNPMSEGRVEGLRQPRPSLKTALGMY